jgi:hydrogenase 3 maturation protease
LPPSWNELLLQKLSPFRKGDQAGLPRICIVGVGSDLRGDDSAGLCVARALIRDENTARLQNILVIEGGLAPENNTGAIRAFRPDLVLLIDAAHMDEPPGTIQWIPLDVIDGMSASSHSLPLSLLASYLNGDLGCDVVVLGIQPEQNELDSELSLSVRAAVNEISLGLSNMLLPGDAV